MLASPGSRAVVTFLAALASVPAFAQKVITGEANLLHGTLIVYPADALPARVEGTVLVSASLNERGVVTDASVVSGPMALRKPALRSILDWHYSPGTASPVQIAIEFTLPPPRPTLLNGQPVPVSLAAAAPAVELRNWDVGILKRIQYVNLPPQLQSMIEGKLPVNVGETFQMDTTARITQMLRNVDDHLTITYRLLDFDGERRQFEIKIALPETAR